MRRNRSERGGFLFHWKWHKQYSCWERAAGKQKVFRCSSFTKMLPRCGRAAHICEANKTVWELQQKSKRELEESQLPSKQKAEMMEQGFRGNCDSQGKLGMCPSLAEPDLGGFPKNYSCNVSCETMLLENHSNPVRQNRFAVCLCAVRRWLRCPNCL